MNESEAKKIVLVSPATAESNNGNWQTAYRWSRLVSGHFDIALQTGWSASTPVADGTDRPAALVALHARRSALSIRAWAQAFPEKPLIVVLTGTDLYRDIAHDAEAQQSLRLATHLVVLQSEGLSALPATLHEKTQVIYQSASLLKPVAKSTQTFTAVMVGHLRDEKDPLTFMQAAGQHFERGTHFVQIGDALDGTLGEAARACERQTPCFRWLGGLAHAATRQRIRRAHVLVNCSKMEGGAHVILEAITSATPVLASRISGNVGMLGDDYAGYFKLGDADALASLVRRCMNEPAFLSHLAAQCARRAPLFAPDEERRLVLNLLTRALGEDWPNPPTAPTFIGSNHERS